MKKNEKFIDALGKLYRKEPLVTNIYECNIPPLCRYILCDDSPVSKQICKYLQKECQEHYGLEPKVLVISKSNFLTRTGETRFSFISPIIQRTIEEKQFPADLIIARKDAIDYLVANGWPEKKFFDSDSFTSSWYPGKAIPSGLHLRKFNCLMPGMYDLKTAVDTAFMYHEQKNYLGSNCQIYFNWFFLSSLPWWQILCFKILLLLLKIPHSAITKKFPQNAKTLGLFNFCSIKYSYFTKYSSWFIDIDVENYLTRHECFDDLIADKTFLLRDLSRNIWRKYNQVIKEYPHLKDKDEEAAAGVVREYMQTPDSLLRVCLRPFRMLIKCLKLAYKYRPLVKNYK